MGRLLSTWSDQSGNDLHKRSLLVQPPCHQSHLKHGSGQSDVLYTTVNLIHAHKGGREECVKVVSRARRIFLGGRRGKIQGEEGREFGSKTKTRIELRLEVDTGGATSQVEVIL